MTYLTVFTAPKPFSNPHINIIQRNAIKSWMQLGSDVEVYLMGDEDGIEQVASEFQVRYFPEVRCNEQGTPYISSMIDLAREFSEAPYLGILNADIMLMPDFFEAIHLVEDQTDKFLLLGRRWDLDVEQEMEFNPGWEISLKEEVENRGTLHGPMGIDYFIFPRELFQNMPDFTIGRSGWDNWTIYHAVKSGWQVVDVTRSVMVVHQNHDYSHLPGGKPHYDLPETKQNIAIAGGVKKMYSVLEADTILVDKKLQPTRMSVPRFLHQLELMVTSEDLQGIRRTVVRRLKKTRRKYDAKL
jgi:hypothetical protein